MKKSVMDEEEQNMLFNEINNLKDLDHPNIIKMFEFFEDNKRYYIVTEICKGGELFDEIINRKRLTEKETSILMKQVLSCISYCHQNYIMHRDLKPENILLESNKEFDQLKIIDFGTSISFKESEFMEEKIGSPYYMAPEMITGTHYTSKVDLWSCGVIAYICLSGNPPFNGVGDSDIIKKVKSGKYSFSAPVWQDVSGDAKNFI